MTDEATSDTITYQPTDEDRLARVTGVLGRMRYVGHGDAALRIILRWGGTDIYVAHAPKPDSELVRLIGQAAADALAEIVTREQGNVRRLIVPSRAKLERTPLSLRILEYPAGTRETATALGVSARDVRMVRNEGRRS